MDNKKGVQPILEDEATLGFLSDMEPALKLPYARVLVVDDVEINLDIAMGMMLPYEMQVDGMTSGQQAIDAIRDEKQKYHAVFMDHLMPGMDGIETVRIIREEIGTDYARTIPIIALTAETAPETEEMFLSRGFQAFIPKPISMAHLDLLLRQWVQDGELEKSFAAAQSTAKGDAHPDSPGGHEQQISLSKIEGLDADKGRERFGGNMEVYLQIVRSFTVNTPLLIGAIRDVNEENLKENYAITVHGIKGSCWGIRADAAGELAENLEKAAKAGDFDFVAANNQFLIETLSKLLADIETALNEGASHRDKQKKDKPDRDVLSKILAACKSFNTTAANALVKELEIFEYESDGELVAWLRENVDQMNNSEIVERLTGWFEVA